jgi:hypothetical protein
MIVEELKRKHYNWPLLGRVWSCNAYLSLKEERFTQCVFSCMVSRSHVLFSAFSHILSVCKYRDGCWKEM